MAYYSSTDPLGKGVQIQASSGNSHTLEMRGEARLHIIRGAKDAWRLCSLPELAKPGDTAHGYRPLLYEG